MPPTARGVAGAESSSWVLSAGLPAPATEQDSREQEGYAQDDMCSGRSLEKGGNREWVPQACFASGETQLGIPLLCRGPRAWSPRASAAQASQSRLLGLPHRVWHWISVSAALLIVTLVLRATLAATGVSLSFSLSFSLGFEKEAVDPSPGVPRPLQIFGAHGQRAGVGGESASGAAAATMAVSQCLLHALQLLRTALAGSTRWVVEPLALVLLLDTLLLTAVGLAYKLINRSKSPRTSSWVSQSAWSSGSSKVHPGASLPVDLLGSGAKEAKGSNAFPSQAHKDGVEALLGVPEETWPKVLVQLPMYNEREVYARAIAAACQMAWPRSRLVVQVLDDSTEEDISAGMRAAVHNWQRRGVDVRYRQRVDRKGYKAGNLREGLTEEYTKDCAYVAVLDADFEPRADWLLQAIPYFEKDSSLALVQTRWTFSNQDDCLLTQLQAVELTWHFWAEQLVSSLALRCFGFNGTAGVWRTAAILDAGNWRDDTTVEDMDMAVCAAMRGWKMLMVPQVECLSEVPATYTAYRKQQNRWTSGPASLLRQRFWSIACTPGQALGWGAKLYLVGIYMVLRRAVRHLVGLALWLLLSLWLLLPALCTAIQHLGAPSVPFSEAHGASCSFLPSPSSASPTGSPFPFPWVSLAFAIIYPACLFCFSPRRLYLYPAYLLFLNGMLPLRVYALLAGLFDLKSSRTWDVTQKLGKKKSSTEGMAPKDSKPGCPGVGVVVSVDRGPVHGAGAAGQLAGRGAAGKVTEGVGSLGLDHSSQAGAWGAPKPSQAAPWFQPELSMGWSLLLVAVASLVWGVVIVYTHQPQAWSYLRESPLQTSLTVFLVIQGCWCLVIGGLRWGPA